VSDARRRAEISVALSAVRERIKAACLVAGRDPAEVTLLTVTKTFPASDVALLTDLGITAFGENRDQEACGKAEEVRRLRPHVAPRWHMIGRLQRNKARSVLRWADVVQSVDSAGLAQVLRRSVAAALDAGTRQDPLDVLVQMSVDADPARGGCPPPELPALAEQIADVSELTLRGVMAVAPMSMDPARAFALLAEMAANLRRDHPTATEISAGMSGDLEDAITHGSTCVRVGSAVLGSRPLAFP
jgi:pyridoxal phosphate enzyme (YggS family)